MGRKLLGYDDAVKLLGGECKVISALNNLAGATLSGLSVGGFPAALAFFPLKDEIACLSQEAIKTLRRRLSGISRFKRSELLEAAHAVLVVGAFFTALDDLDAELGTALNSASLELTKSEQAVIAGSSGSAGFVNLAHELIKPGRIPGLYAGMNDQRRELSHYYGALAENIVSFALGTSVWDSRDETTRYRWQDAVIKAVPKRAVACYQEQLVQLSGEFPEFAFWAHRVGIQVILDELAVIREDSTDLGITLQSASKLLAKAAHGPNPDKVRADLITRYRDQIAKPVAGVAAGTIPDEVKLPSLQRLYVTPSYRMMPWSAGGIERITEPGWKSTTRRADLGAMVLEHLISTEAARVPMVLLGQPGAGKSVFSQMLAAELDPRDYLVVRVGLRAVPSDTSVQEQIQAALTGLTGRSITWPELAEAAGDAQPVILLDGFDELLQASGVSHFDFLERVQAFQEREAELHRPVAVLVTSRTAVANQVRYPAGTSVVRLEEFDDGQVDRWLSVWNQENPIRPLVTETALAQGDLSRQPLLLFLLALFHSGGGNLTPGINQAHLFERLFNNFVERDVAKLDKQLTEKQQQRAIQHDLDSLSMVAFAMFNRGRQSVTETDLIADLTALQPESSGLTGQSGRTTALTIAERMADRFFFRLFLHRDEAMRGQQAMLSTYEFLHASFGEFLVGRWIVGELSRLGDKLRLTADDPYPAAPDDSKLHALLSMTALSTREQRVLGFIGALLTEMSDADLAGLRVLVPTLFRTSLRPRSHNAYPLYQPSQQTAPAAYAAYSANLVLLVLLISEAENSNRKKSDRAKVAVAELYALGSATSTEESSSLANFNATTRLWHAQLTNTEWVSLLDVIRIYAPQYSNQRTEISLREQYDRLSLISGYETLSCVQSADRVVDFRVELGTSVGRAFREAALLGVTGYQGACTALLPYLGAISTQDADYIFDNNGDAAASMLAVLIRAPQLENAQRTDIYTALFKGADEATGAEFFQQRGIHAVRLLLGRLRDDMHYFTLRELSKMAVAGAPFAWTHITAYLDIVAQINRTNHSSAKTRRDSRYSRTLNELLEAISLPERSQRRSPRQRGGGSGRAWQNVNDLVMGLTPRDLITLLDPLSCETETRVLFESLGINTPQDVIALISLRDFFGLNSVREMRNLYSGPFMPDRSYGPSGPSWEGWDSSPIFRFALVAAMKQRELPIVKSPVVLEQSELEWLDAFVPGFTNPGPAVGR